MEQESDDFCRGLMYALPLSAILWGFILLGLAWVAV